MKIKHILFILCFFVASFICVSCATTGKLEYVGNKSVVYGYSVDQIPETCEKYQLFTSTIFSKSYYNPNFIIGRHIKNNLTKPIFVKSLPNGIRKNDRLLVFDNTTNVIDFYITEKKNTLKYSFLINIDNQKLSDASSLSFEYDAVLNKYYYWKNEAEEAANPVMEKTRQVPYTAYRSVSKTRTVTKYRTKYDFYSGVSYQEPYTDYEYYKVQEPYTAYRTEKYLAPNPKYNPTASIEYQSMATKYESQAIQIQEKINSITWYSVYFND